MELKNGKVYFSSASKWGELIVWLKKKGKRPTLEPWAIEFRADKVSACLVQTVEEIPKVSIQDQNWKKVALGIDE